jgi:hypothetical protein
VEEDRSETRLSALATTTTVYAPPPPSTHAAAFPHAAASPLPTEGLLANGSSTKLHMHPTLKPLMPVFRLAPKVRGSFPILPGIPPHTASTMVFVAGPSVMLGANEFAMAPQVRGAQRSALGRLVFLRRAYPYCVFARVLVRVFLFQLRVCTLVWG